MQSLASLNLHTNQGGLFAKSLADDSNTQDHCVEITWQVVMSSTDLHIIAHDWVDLV